MNKNGQLPPGNDVWQFNLHFNIQEDMYSHDSLDVLKQAGFDFNKHQVRKLRFRVHLLNLMSFRNLCKFECFDSENSHTVGYFHCLMSEN